MTAAKLQPLCKAHIFHLGYFDGRKYTLDQLQRETKLYLYVTTIFVYFGNHKVFFSIKLSKW